MNFLRFFLIFRILIFCHAQTYTLTVYIKDAFTHEPVSFCPIKIHPIGQTTLTGIDGKAKIFISRPAETLEIFSPFHKPEIFKISVTDYLSGIREIRVWPKEQTLLEITVVPGKNPADEIVAECARRMSRYTPFSADHFYALKRSQMRVLLSDRSGNEAFYEDDDSLIPKINKYKNFIKNKYLYYIENHSELFHKKNKDLRERVIYTYAPGFKKSPFSLFFASLQSFGFFEDEIRLLDEVYLSPLSEKGRKVYHFKLSDSLFLNSDTFYVIDVIPPSSSLYSLLQGKLYIHASEYYLKGVDMRPSRLTEKYLYSTRQFYDKSSEGLIYPRQTDSYLLVPNSSLKDRKGKPIYIKFRLYMELPVFRTDTIPDFKDQPSPIDEAANLSEHPLIPNSDSDSLKIRSTCEYSDSLLPKIHMERKLKILTALTTGLIPMGKIGWEWPMGLRFNRVEGYAPGLYITSLPMPQGHWMMRAGVRYGFGDKEWKGIGALGYRWPDRNKNYYSLQAGILNEISENGSYTLMEDLQIFREEQLRSLNISRAGRFVSYFFRSRLEWVKEWTLNTTFHHLVMHSVASWKRNGDLIYEYACGLAELHAHYRSGRYYLNTSLGRFPYEENKYGSEVELYYRKSWKNSFSYLPYLPIHRMDVVWSYAYFPTEVSGILSILRAGYAFEISPYHWLYHHHASRTENFSLSYRRGMETMFYNEFMSAHYVQWNFSIRFRRWLPVNEKFNPELECVHNLCWGKTPSRQNYYSVPMSVPDRIYTEAGLKILRVLKGNAGGLGLGIFYRYGNYAHENNRYNWIFKLAVTYQL